MISQLSLYALLGEFRSFIYSSLMPSLFPWQEYWSFYLGFTLFVMFVLTLDLGVFHRKAHVVSFRESAIWTVIWISLALVFNFLLWRYCLWKFPQDPRLLAFPDFQPEIAAKGAALEFLTGFIVEKTLAVDNIFVFVLIFSYFRVPALYQHRVLFFGIIGALLFRAIFIALGAVLMEYHWVVWIFGGFLIFTGFKMMFSDDKKIDPDQNFILKLLKKMIRVTPNYHGERFFIKQNAKVYATPLFITLIFIELSDIIFAVDSVPAIFAITKEPFLVYTSNIFAILGLRAMYFMLAGLVDQFIYLKYGLALVLIFVGLKMVWLNEAFDGKFPIVWSLGIIATLIAGSIAASLLYKPKENI